MCILQVMVVTWSEPPFPVKYYTLYYNDVTNRDSVIQTKRIDGGGRLRL